MEIFLDDFCTFNTKHDHLKYLGKYLDQYAIYRIFLNSDKYQFGIPSRKILEHIVSKSDIAIDPDKV